LFNNLWNNPTTVAKKKKHRQYKTNKSTGGVEMEAKLKKYTKKKIDKFECDTCEERFKEFPECEVCQDSMEYAVDDYWCSGTEHFCSAECCAMWRAEATSFTELEEED